MELAIESCCCLLDGQDSLSRSVTKTTIELHCQDQSEQIMNSNDECNQSKTIKISDNNNNNYIRRRCRSKRDTSIIQSHRYKQLSSCDHEDYQLKQSKLVTLNNHAKDNNNSKLTTINSSDANITQQHSTVASISLSAFWLPIILILLLPQSNHNQNKDNNSNMDNNLVNFKQQFNSFSTSRLLLNIMQFPIDRMQLISLGGPLLGNAQFLNAASNQNHNHNHNHHLHQQNQQQPTYIGKVSQIPQNIHTTNGQQVAALINDRQDLAEEESHMLLMNPGETLPTNQQQRGAIYAGQPYRQVDAQQQQYESIQPGYATDTSSSGQQSTSDNYVIGLDQAGISNVATVGGSSGATSDLQLQPEASSLGTTSDHLMASNSRQRTAPLQVSSSAALQTRADLPSVSALNVKCEKNHMKVIRFFNNYIIRYLIYSYISINQSNNFHDKQI